MSGNYCYFRWFYYRSYFQRWKYSGEWFSIASIRISIESMKIVYSRKNGCSSLPNQMIWFSTDKQCWNLFCWTKFRKTEHCGIQNRRVQYFRKFGWVRWNSDDQTLGLEDTLGTLFREPWHITDTKVQRQALKYVLLDHDPYCRTIDGLLMKYLSSDQS
jgi:hypothetical protein